MDRITDKYRLAELPRKDFTECNHRSFQDPCSNRKSRDYGDDQQPVSHALAKEGFLGILGIRVYGVVVSSQTRKVYDIGFRDRPPRADDTCAYLELFEIVSAGL